jgi:hypothetical protein
LWTIRHLQWQGDQPCTHVVVWVHLTPWRRKRKQSTMTLDSIVNSTTLLAFIVNEMLSQFCIIKVATSEVWMGHEATEARLRRQWCWRMLATQPLASLQRTGKPCPDTKRFWSVALRKRLRSTQPHVSFQMAKLRGMGTNFACAGGCCLRKMLGWSHGLSVFPPS